MRTWKINCLLVVLLASSLFAAARPISVCSFNVQWVGSSGARDNEALAALVAGYDIVVVQEVISPPYPGIFPDGTPFKPSPKTRQFFDAMRAKGFEYMLSEEDTGPGSKIHSNGSATEWFVSFYKTNAVRPAIDLP